MKKIDIKSLKVAIGTLVFMIMITIIISNLIISRGTYKDISLGEVMENISNSVELNEFKLGKDKDLKRLYGLSINDFDEAVIYTPKTNMDVNEILIIKVKDSSQIDAVEEAVENRVKNQLNSFEGYGVEQCDLLDDYEVKIIGSYIFYGVAENIGEIKSAFKDAVQ